uniref:Uncharacterized protein n=1 Tax=viral metagenome TaxID=1070528 RepID=A0A6C0IDM1_9ZZZZ
MVLSFYFNVHDPEFSSITQVVSSDPGKYTSLSYVKAPLYDSDTNVMIGYKVTTDTLQQVGDSLYYITNYSTYQILGQGTISWNGFYENTIPSHLYPVGTQLKSNIVSTSGQYLGQQGTVKLTVLPSGQRNVRVKFCAP